MRRITKKKKIKTNEKFSFKCSKDNTLWLSKVLYKEKEDCWAGGVWRFFVEYLVTWLGLLRRCRTLPLSLILIFYSDWTSSACWYRFHGNTTMASSDRLVLVFYDSFCEILWSYDTFFLFIEKFKIYFVMLFAIRKKNSFTPTCTNILWCLTQVFKKLFICDATFFPCLIVSTLKRDGFFMW